MFDHHQIERVNGTVISPSSISVTSMPDRVGSDVAREVGGRYLLRYLVDSQLTSFTSGDGGSHYVTPTPIAPEDVVHWLYLPSAHVPRNHALVLDASKIPIIRGPGWVDMGSGIEYYLPHGFPQVAIVRFGVIVVR